MTSNAVEGEWGNFVFKMITPKDHERVLQHLRDHFYYGGLYRIGYTKEMDDEMEEVFKEVLNDGYNFHFLAEDKQTGKIAGCRIITMEKKVRPPGAEMKSRICRGFMKFYHEFVDECKLFERYDKSGKGEIPHMFGVAVAEEFGRQGLATEIYRRAKGLMKERGHDVAFVSFISPYSRAAGNHNGFISLVSYPLLEIKGEDEAILYPQADPNDFIDGGVFLVE